MNAAIIGRGWRTPLGSGIEAAVGRFLAGELPFVPHPRFDASAYACRTVAPIVDEPAESPHARYLARIGLLAVEAARDAVAEAAIDVPSHRLGLYTGVGGLRARWDEILPALVAQQDDEKRAWELGLRQIHPYWMLRHLSNNAHALLAIDLPAHGDGATLAGGNAGAQALAVAIRALAAGAIDAAVVVAYDSVLEPETLVEMAARQAATQADFDKVVPPYRDGSAGVVPGEAACAVVLVRDGSVRIAADTAADASRGTPGAATIARLARGRVDLVDGAGVAHPAIDAEEQRLVRGVAGDPRWIATSGGFGHTGAAAAVLQAIALPEILRRTGGSTALGLSAAAPGLAGAVHLEIA
jgi:3-oxoacyl-(acyl-carrier-protein) synthase